MVGAGILARNALARGLRSKPWVKTSLAPGSKVVTEYLDRAGLTEPLEAARLQPRRLRLHDLHRQLRAAAGGDLEGRRRGRSGGRLGAVGQPQLRGADQPGREDELPRLAAAVRRLCAGGHDGHRHRRRAAGPDEQGRTSTCATSGPPSARSPTRSSEAVQCGHVPPSYAEVFAGDERWHALEAPTGERFAWDAGLDLRPPAALLRGHARRARARARHRRRARAGAARRQRHDRPHLPGRRDQARRARRTLPAGAGRCAARLQLLRLAPRQPRGDGARHVRQHPAAQPARAGHRGRSPFIGPPPGRPRGSAGESGGADGGRPPASRCRSTTPRCATSPTASPLVVLGGAEYGSGSSRDWAAKGTDCSACAR